MVDESSPADVGAGGRAYASDGEPAPAGRPELFSPDYDWSRDEVVERGGVAAAYGDVVKALETLGPDAIARRREAAEGYQQAHGVGFRVTGESEHRSFPVDVLPRIVEEAEWDLLSRGLEQRARTLDALLCDVYGEAAAVRDEVLPSWVFDVPGFSPAGRAFGSQVHRAPVCGTDLVRDAGGRWWVLEDNVRVPSGLGYAIQNRRMTDEVMPELPRPPGLCDVSAAPMLLRAALRDTAPDRTSGESRIVLLSEGPGGSAWFEHSMLAAEMGIELVLAGDLMVEEERLYETTRGTRRTVDVVYFRMSDLELMTATGADGLPLGPRLLAAVEAGNVAVANALGNGVADDKAVYSRIPSLIDYYLAEKPILEPVPTYLCRYEDDLQLVMSRLDRLVLKPVDGYGGNGVVVGSMASESELNLVRNQILASPASWIAQEIVELSTHPSMTDRGPRARHVDLRAFVFVSDVTVVAPAALTRVAPEGSMIVNSSRGGGSKDTWIVCGSSGRRLGEVERAS